MKRLLLILLAFLAVFTVISTFEKAEASETAERASIDTVSIETVIDNSIGNIMETPVEKSK